MVSEFKLSGSWWKLAESSTFELTSAKTSLFSVSSNDHICCRFSKLHLFFFLFSWLYIVHTQESYVVQPAKSNRIENSAKTSSAFLFLKNKNISLTRQIRNSWDVFLFFFSSQEDQIRFFHIILFLHTIIMVHSIMINVRLDCTVPATITHCQLTIHEKWHKNFSLSNPDRQWKFSA